MADKPTEDEVLAEVDRFAEYNDLLSERWDEAGRLDGPDRVRKRQDVFLKQLQALGKFLKVVSSGKPNRPLHYLAGALLGLQNGTSDECLKPVKKIGAPKTSPEQKLLIGKILAVMTLLLERKGFCTQKEAAETVVSALKPKGHDLNHETVRTWYKQRAPYFLDDVDEDAVEDIDKAHCKIVLAEARRQKPSLSPEKLGLWVLDQI